MIGDPFDQTEVVADGPGLSLEERAQVSSIRHALFHVAHPGCTGTTEERIIRSAEDSFQIWTARRIVIHTLHSRGAKRARRTGLSEFPNPGVGGFTGGSGVTRGGKWELAFECRELTRWRWRRRPLPFRVLHLDYQCSVSMSFRSSRERG